MAIGPCGVLYSRVKVLTPLNITPWHQGTPQSLAQQWLSHVAVTSAALRLRFKSKRPATLALVLSLQVGVQPVAAMLLHNLLLVSQL